MLNNLVCMSLLLFLMFYYEYLFTSYLQMEYLKLSYLLILLLLLLLLLLGHNGAVATNTLSYGSLKNRFLSGI
jgi:hypothetical protein